MGASSRWQRYVDAATSGPTEGVAQGPEPVNREDTGDRSPRGLTPQGEGALGRSLSVAAAVVGNRVRHLLTVDDSAVEATEARTWDLRLVPAALISWTGAIAFIRVLPLWGYSAGFASLLAAAFALGLSRRLRLHLPLTTAAVPLLCLSLVAFSAAETSAERTAGPISEAIAGGSSVTAQLRIASDPVQSATAAKFSGVTQYLVEATIVRATAAGNRFSAATPVLIIADDRWSTVRTGELVDAAGEVKAAGSGDDVEALFFAGTSPRVIEPAGHWNDLTTGIRESFQTRAAASSPGAAQLLSGMVLGDRSSLGSELETAMKRTGLTHLTAVSGANCAVILGVVFLFGYAVHLPRWLAAVVALLALAGFVTLVRPDPSVLRAAVMGTIGILAVMNGRGRRSPTLLCIAVVILLSLDPWLSGSYAFILSVLATTGLIVFGSRCARWLSRWLPLWAAQAVAVPIAAQVFCAPVIVLLQPHLLTYSVVANVLVAPVIPLVTVAGMAAVLTLFVCPVLVPVLITIAGAGAQWVAFTAHFFSAAPAAAAPWPAGAIGVVLMAAVSIGSLGLIWSISHPTHRRLAAAVISGLLPGRHSSALYRSVTALALGVLLGVGPALLVSGSGVLARNTDWSIAACDVGQGDGLVIRTGAHSAIVVDTGPEPKLMDRCLTDLRISTVEVLMITHLHADHSGGIPGVLNGRTVERAMISTVGETVPSAVMSVLTEDGVDVVRARRGQSGSQGPVHWQILWPPVDHRAGTENNASIVLALRVRQPEGSDLSILLTGDLEQDGLRSLLHVAGASDVSPWSSALLHRRVDILKIAHHGAENGGTTLITELDPAIALISVGADNDYGHPSAEIITALKQSGTHVGRTDLDGRIHIGKESGTLRMWSQR